MCSEWIRVFNFSVANAHSYFVGGDGVLVHNARKYPRIHTVADDWAEKGAHVTTSKASNELEIYIRGGGRGGPIKIGAVFSRDKNDSCLKKAIAEVENAIQDKKWRNKLLHHTRDATKRLGSSSITSKWFGRHSCFGKNTRRLGQLV